MPHNRYYLDIFFQENKTVTLVEDEHHHLCRVLRAEKGDPVELVNGRGQLAVAEVTELQKRHSELKIVQVNEKIEQKPALILAQALTRMNHLEWIIEKGTELNVTEFWLFPGILSEKDRISETQALRLKSLAISAMKQCGRLDLPSIELKPPLLRWEAMQGTLLFGNPSDNVPYLWDIGFKKPLPSPVVLFIGPESGFDLREREFLHNVLNAKEMRLHPNILRAETASIVSLSLIQSYIS